MATSEPNEPRPAKRLLDGISCVGLLLLGLFALGAVIGIAGNRIASSRDNENASPTQVPTNGAPPTALPAIESLPALAMEAPTEGSAEPVPTPASGRSEPAATEVEQTQAEISTAPAAEPLALATDAEMPEPLPTPVGVYSLTLRVPILMYHYISQPPEGADIYRQDLSVKPEEFQAQMQYFVGKGYTSISLNDLSLAVVGKKELPAKPIIITFDDGYRDNYENAFPVLRDLGLQATFFVVTDFVDQNNPEYMSWAMIEEMAAAGMRIEPHSKSHLDLPGRSRDFLIWEILGSRDTLEAHLGSRPRYFAYPGGHYDDAVVQIVQELDFWGAVTTEGGLWHGYNDRFEWKRVRMRYETTLEILALMLEEEG